MIITGIDLEGFTIKAPGRTAGLPTIGTATVLSNTSANVTFTAPADQGDSPIIGYTAIAFPGSIRNEVLNPNASNITITNLTPGTQYTLSVTANNSDGPSANSDSSNLITTWDVPGAPTGQIFKLTSTSANLYYTLPNIGNVEPIALVAQSNTGTILATLHNISGNTSGNLKLTALTPNTNYTIQLSANNLFGFSTFNTLTPFTTSLIPDAPTILYTQITSASTANIVFNAPENIGSGIISYTANANSTAYATVVQSGSGNITLSGLTPNTRYSFNVFASSAQGNSSPSVATSATTWGATANASPSSVGEGNVLTVNVVTYNITNGTTLYWSTNHITTSNVDFVSNIDSGSFTVTSGTGSFTVNPVSDLTTEGPETFTLSIRSSNTSGAVITTTSSTTINDTSETLPGQTEYTTAGTYTWTAPGSFPISIVCVGAGGGGWYPNYTGGGGGGGALVWVNNIPVIGGNTYTVTVGAGGAVSTVTGGSNTWFIGNTYIMAGAGTGGSGAQNGPFTVGTGGTYINNSGFPGGGGTGGNGGGFGTNFGGSGGGGAAGYSGSGGTGGATRNGVGTAATGGGGGGGGATSNPGQASGAGGGVGIYGQGPNGLGGTGQSGGTGGSGGTSGDAGAQGGAVGGRYGGGGGGGTTNQSGPLYDAGPGTNGAVRIIWPGTTRQYPSTNTANV
jgi:hypothetical protein